MVKWIEMCLAEFLTYNCLGKVVIESKRVHQLPCPKFTKHVLCTHTDVRACTYTHAHASFYPQLLPHQSHS